jgi:phasin family protein
MSSTDNKKPPGKPAQRSRKAKRETRKPDQRQSPKPDQQPVRQLDERELIDAAVAPTETFATAADAPAGISSTAANAWPTEPASTRALVPMESSPTGTAVSVDTFLTGFQTIANAYGDYIRKSLELTRSFVETLIVVRSPDKAIEIQTEFAKQACETFLIDSQKIWRLYSELARQVFRPFERLVMRVTQAAR